MYPACACVCVCVCAGLGLPVCTMSQYKTGNLIQAHTHTHSLTSRHLLSQYKQAILFRHRHKNVRTHTSCPRTHRQSHPGPDTRTHADMHTLSQPQTHRCSRDIESHGHSRGQQNDVAPEGEKGSVSGCGAVTQGRELLDLGGHQRLKQPCSHRQEERRQQHKENDLRTDGHTDIRLPTNTCILNGHIYHTK